MQYHVLNGDALVDRFQASGLAGTVLVCREAFMEGDLHGNTLLEFWHTRSQDLSRLYSTEPGDYYANVVHEFEAILAAPREVEFNLWFGHDVFCQVNLWFVLYLLTLRPEPVQAFIVYPTYLPESDIWREFGPATAEDLLRCFSRRIEVNAIDFDLAGKLWRACRNNNVEALREMGQGRSVAFPYLHDVCQAYADRFPVAPQISRPERVVREIIRSFNRVVTFSDVFQEFTRREGIYGMGDLQVKALYDKVMHTD
jgi:hypothetical protein